MRLGLSTTTTVESIGDGVNCRSHTGRGRRRSCKVFHERMVASRLCTSSVLGVPGENHGHDEFATTRRQTCFSAVLVHAIDVFLLPRSSKVPGMPLRASNLMQNHQMVMHLIT